MVKQLNIIMRRTNDENQQKNNQNVCHGTVSNGIIIPAKTVCAGNSFNEASTFQLGPRINCASCSHFLTHQNVYDSLGIDGVPNRSFNVKRSSYFDW